MYVSVDGDDIGKKLTNIIYKKSEEEITEFSNYVADYFIRVKEKVLALKGDVIFCAGDSIAFKIEDQNLSKIIDEMQTDRFNVTIGCGNNIQQAHWALNIAKSLGKDQIAYFDDLKNMLCD